MSKPPLYNSIRELARLIKTGKVTPTELTEFFLDRLERHGPKFNSVVTVTRKLALKQAKKAEKEIEKGVVRGLLHGIPYGAKDLLATKDIPTTWGAEPLRNQVFDYDATVVRKLEKAGAILCGKLAMIELAGGGGYRQPNASLTGPPRNPWNLNTWTGGSSSGSGAAVSAGLLPFAIGSETWGSILSPANNCGVSGLRPTYGRVSRMGAMALSWTLDKLGPLALTADDCGVILEAISGFDPQDPSTIDYDYHYDIKPKRGFRIGVLKGIAEDANEEVKRNFERSLNELKGFCKIEEVELPDLPYEAISRTILNSEAASAFEEFIESGKTHALTAPEDHYSLYSRTTILATDYLRALRLRRKMAEVMVEALDPLDAIVAPSSKKPATPIDQEFRKVAPGATKDVMGAIGSGTGLPAISVPNGFTESGLPTGVQFMGKVYDENTIIAIARKYQRKTDYHKKHPFYE